jgi:hypothetical protein
MKFLSIPTLPSFMDLGRKMFGIPNVLLQFTICVKKNIKWIIAFKGIYSTTPFKYFKF